MIGSLHIAFAALILLAEAPLRATDDAALQRGRQITKDILAGDTGALQQRTSEGFLKAVGGPEGLKKFVEGIRTSLGPEVDVRDEVAFKEAGLTAYYRHSRFEKVPDVTIRWVVDDKGVFHGGNVRPTVTPAKTDHLGYRTKASLRLPFANATVGNWYVAWGGRDHIHNKHVVAVDQRFGYDFLVLKDTMPFSGNGKRNEDHYCFGQPLFAPAAGKIVAALDGLIDNPVGVRDEKRPAGNHVVIDHGRSEFSFLAHLQKGSVAVKPGQRVAKGALVGRCGNSGQSDLPHLHYHLQTTPIYEAGAGLPSYFNDYVSGDKRVKRGEPVRGEYLTLKGR
jgi:murein DD-endopeptidase MepM/ murein hydrolase activator NlpD